MAVAVGPTNLSSSSEITVSVSSSAPALQAPGPQIPVGYKMYFNDEFENKYSGAPNPANWDYTIDYTINGEDQCYTDNRRENVRVEHRSTEGYTNGYLVLQLRKEQFPCKQDANKTYQYTSGSIQTRKRAWGNYLVDMPHGRYEIRAKIPAGRGTWPAIWLLGDSSLGGWPNSGEIDIMEIVGYEEVKGLYRSHSTIHRNPSVGMWPNQWGTTGQGQDYYHNVPLSNDFHVWAMEWTPTTLTFYVDGKVVDKRVVVGDRIEIHNSFIRSEFEGSGTPLGWPFSRETPGAQFRMLLNLAWGGGWGGQEGLDDAIFGKGDVEMLVDYVRVYVKN
jgi:beta-glucanase (GH16 family)